MAVDKSLVNESVRESTEGEESSHVSTSLNQRCAHTHLPKALIAD